MWDDLELEPAVDITDVLGYYEPDDKGGSSNTGRCYLANTDDPCRGPIDLGALLS